MKETIKTFLQNKDVSYFQIEGDEPSLVFHTTESGYEKATENQSEWEKELGLMIAPSNMFGMYVIIFEKEETE